MTTIDERLKAVIAAEVADRRRFVTLEEMTGIGQDSWKAVWQGRQKPTIAMIEKVARLWPDYAYWLACGDTEPERGHIAPSSVESSYPVIRGCAQKWATAERIYKQKLLQDIPSDPEQRAAFEKELRDEVFKLKEQLVMPAVHINYEKIMRFLGQEPKDDLFPVEYDNQLRKIRLDRWEEELALQKKVSKERKLLGESKDIEYVIKAVKRTSEKAWNAVSQLFKKDEF